MDEKALEIFIGKNADKYLRRFQTFSRDGDDRFQLTWHWPAFFTGPIWMLYRKLYLWALLAFLLGIFIGRIFIYGQVVLWVVWGMTGYYLYYRHAKKKANQLVYSSSLSEEQRIGKLARQGGVNVLAATIASLLSIGIVLTPSIVKLYAAQQRSNYVMTTSDIRVIGRALEEYYEDHHQYPIQPAENVLVETLLPSEYYSGPFQDKWNNAFRYVSQDGTSYMVISYGFDKEKGKNQGPYSEDLVFSDGRFLAPAYLRN